MPRTAKIGPEVFARVNELVGQGKSRTEAFAAVAEERGSRPGTVAANYYRTARSTPASGATGRRRTGRRSAAQRTARSRSVPREATLGSTGDPELTALASEIAALTKELVRKVEDRDAKLRALLG
jgi:hypothetical protein